MPQPGFFLKSQRENPGNEVGYLRAPADKLTKAENTIQSLNCRLGGDYVNLTFALSFLFHELHVWIMQNLGKADFALANRDRFSVSCWLDGDQIFFQVQTL